jgi:manganese/iron transport system permease protein
LNDLVGLLSAPLHFELTMRALTEISLVGVACGALSVLVVLRGLSFIGDALGHCVVPGVVVGYLAHSSLELWGFCSAILSAAGMASLRRSARLGGDASIAILFTISFALGLALISSSRSYFTDLTEILFGNILGVKETDLAVGAACALVVLTTLTVLFRPLVLIAFDATSAQALGLPRAQLDLVLYALIALAIVSGAVAAGSLLVSALLIVPGAAARLIARSVRGQMVAAGGIGCVSGWIGLYCSYYWRLASGGAIVLASVGLFGVALVLSSCLRQQRAFKREMPYPTLAHPPAL